MKPSSSSKSSSSSSSILHRLTSRLRFFAANYPRSHRIRVRPSSSSSSSSKSSSNLHRIRSRSSDFCLLATTLCLLSAVLCPLTRASGSWLVDGQAVQSLEVQTTNDDPNALHTDGTRTMAAPLEFDAAVSTPTTGLFRVYIPWSGATYDLFTFDSVAEAIKLSAGTDQGFFPTRDLFIQGTTIGDDSGGGARVDLGEMTLKGGSWMVDAVGPYDDCIISKGYANAAYSKRNEIQCLIVDVSSNALQNGTALLAAYTQAKTMSPSAAKQITIIVPPASYDLGSSTLVMDTDYIHLAGAVPVTLTMPGEVEIVWTDYDLVLDAEVALTNYAVSAVLSGEKPHSSITGTATVISNVVANTSVANIKVEGAVRTAPDKSAVWRDVWFSGGVDAGAASSNTFIRVVAPAGMCAAGDFHGHLQDSIVSGNYSFGGTGGTAAGSFVGNTISGTGCIGSGSGGSVGGTFSRNIIMGDGCVGESTLIDALFVGNTIAGMNCVGGSGGTINGTFIDNTILGMSTLGWDGGTVNASFLRDTISGASTLGECTVNGTFSHCSLSGAWQLEWGTITTNAAFQFTSGLPPSITNTSARIVYCSDTDHNPLPNQ